MTRTAAAASQRRHGLAGLLVALFVVAGLLSSYGLGHGAPLRVCTQHALSVPSAAADAQAGRRLRPRGGGKRRQAGGCGEDGAAGKAGLHGA